MHIAPKYGMKKDWRAGYTEFEWGNFFFGESMFSKRSNASKYAFIRYVEQLKTEGVQMIDCQVYTEHLETLGARMIPRTEFIAAINRLL